MTATPRLRPALGLATLIALVAAAWLDHRFGWIEPAFDAVAHLFYEVPGLAAIRRPTQLALVRMHLAILGVLAGAGLVLASKLDAHAGRWWAVFCVAYAIRAAVWVAGGNLPLVPGDSNHYLEVATSVYRGEGAVKHYVESYFLDYAPHLRAGGGILDDWATPLYAYVLAVAYRLTGVVPGESLESTVAVAKGVSFVANLLCLPALYVFARRRFGAGVALGAMALLAVLPVHAIYAGFGLRESLVALTSILAVGFLVEIGHARGAAAWGWAIAAGVSGGLAVLARNTAMALLAASGLHALLTYGRRSLGPLLLWGAVALAVVGPWAYETYREYGEPFFTYTKYFEYNFSWTVHHYDQGNTSSDQFYTAENRAEIVRVKLKAVAIIAATSTMILGLPVVLGFLHRLRFAPREAPGRDVDRLVVLIFLVFVAATLARVADITQVAQLGRYYMPVFVLMLPTAAAGLGSTLRDRVAPSLRPFLAASLVALLWSDPTWAYDATWFVKPYQLHGPALREAGQFVREHPEQVPPDARILTWFPWEFRVASDRFTVLMPRSYYPPHIERAIERYGVTHVLWGSFEPPPNVDPESWGPYLRELRLGLGLTDERQIYQSPKDLPFPVRLYDIRGTRR